MKTLTGYINERFINKGSNNIINSIIKHFEIDNLVKEDYLNKEDKENITDKFRQFVEKNNFKIDNLKFYKSNFVNLHDEEIKNDFNIDGDKTGKYILFKDFDVERCKIFSKATVEFYICDKEKKFILRVGPICNAIRTAAFEQD